MAVSYVIDGHLNRDFYSSEEWEDASQRPYELQPWSLMRGVCHDLIKGTKAPSAFSFVLHLKPEFIGRTLSEVSADTVSAVQALVLNIRLDSTGLHLVTGVSMRGFSLDKSPDKIWDKTMERFLASKGISVSDAMQDNP